MSGRAALSTLLLAGMSALHAQAQELSPQEVFRQVSPSVVVIEVNEFPEGRPARLIASGSGVVIPSRKNDKNVIATNCHLVDQSRYGTVSVSQGEVKGIGWVAGRDAARDLCLVHALSFDVDAKGVPLRGQDGKVAYRKLPAARIGSSQWLEVGDPVFAVGAPQGLELSLSNGIVSGFREYEGMDYVQTTAPISKGSSGGGLFDAQGRLVGITTMYLKDAQALNFAAPAEWIASVPEVARGASARSSATAATASAAADDAAAAADAVADAEAAEFDRKPRDRWWTFYEDGEREIAFDTQTIQRSGSSVTVWERTRYAKPRQSASGKALYIERVVRFTYYCGSRQRSFDQVTSRNSSGGVVASEKLRSWEIERTSLMPETLGEAAYEAACS